MKDENTEKCEKILRHYGAEKQRKVLAEECAELIQAIMKLERKPDQEAWAHFIEEMADVEIMLEQMKIDLSAKDFGRFLITTSRKLNRQLDRIAKGE